MTGGAPCLFESLLAQWENHPIPNCPGRWLLLGPARLLSPTELLGPLAARYTPRRHLVPTALDPVWIARFPEGGLLSYEKSSGLWVHSINDSAGFRRKLEALGIPE